MTLATFNYLEALFWWTVAGVILIKSRPLHGDMRRVARAATITFIVFGISDIIEAHTGAWWRPIWLFVLKAGCVLSLVICLIKYKKIASGEKNE